MRYETLLISKQSPPMINDFLFKNISEDYYLLDVLKKSKDSTNSNTVNVGWGEIGYSRGPLQSDGFQGCSAVALGNGEEGFLAHAYCIVDKGYEVDFENVVDKLVEEAMRRNIDLADFHAFVSAGSRGHMDIISRDLRRKGILVRRSGVGFSPADGRKRSVYFDPVNDIFKVSMEAEPELGEFFKEENKYLFKEKNHLR